MIVEYNKATRSPEISHQKVQKLTHVSSLPPPSYLYPYLALFTLTKHEMRQTPPPPLTIFFSRNVRNSITFFIFGQETPLPQPPGIFLNYKIFGNSKTTPNRYNPQLLQPTKQPSQPTKQPWTITTHKTTLNHYNPQNNPKLLQPTKQPSQPTKQPWTITTLTTHKTTLNECRLAANAVVLVIGGYQISIAKYLRGVSTLI